MNDSVRERAFNETSREAASLVEDMIRDAGSNLFHIGDAAREVMALGVTLACAERFERCALDLGAFYTEHGGQRGLAVPTSLASETVGKAHAYAQAYANAIRIARAINDRVNESLAASFNPNCLH